MTINPDYKFTVSLSKDIYRNKEQTTAAITSDEKGGKWLREKCGLKDKLCFKAKTIIPSQLLDMSLDGHTFCSLFGNFTTPPPKKTYIRKDGYFTMEGKCSQFFQGSYFIGVDIDDTKYTPREFISFLRLKPTLWYTSLSHMKEDKNKDGQLDSRFRLIYVFDSLIQDPYYFRYYASTLYKMIEKDTVENIEDKCGMRCSQYFNGTYVFDEDPNIDFELNNYIYSLNDISVSDEGYLEFLSKGCEYSNITKEHKENISDRIFKLLYQSDIIKH